MSCFLGLQDIEIGFGDPGIRAALSEATRVLKPGGVLAIADEYTIERFRELLCSLSLTELMIEERAVDTRWSREVAERAIELYADGWQGQVRSDDPAEKERARADALARMRDEMEGQLASKGSYVPFGPIRLAIARKVRG